MTSVLPMKLRGPSPSGGKMAPLDRIAQLGEYREVLITYLRYQTAAEDWHAVSDVANDLRELDVEIRMVEDLL